MLARRAIATGIFGQIPLNRQIANLFRGGEQGAWFDPSDFSTLFQDSAGTTPVTAVGQPVGRMLDKSGRGNHASQPTAINRPVLQQDASGRYYLAFNGANSCMSTAAIDFTGTDKITVCAGVRKLSDVNIGCIAELSSSIGNNGSFSVQGPCNNNLARYGFTSRGTVSEAFMGSLPYSHYPGVNHVLSCALDNSLLTSSLAVKPRLNGALMPSGNDGIPTTQAGNFGNYPLYIGARAGALLFFNGSLYGLIIRGASSPDAQISAAEKFLNQKTGAWSS